LIFVSWGSNAPIRAVDLSDNSVSTIITTSFTNIDGIAEDNDGNYYISTWSPDQIAKYDNDFANAPEVVTTPFLNNPADISYAKEIDTLAIPHYPNGGDDVAFVGFAMDTMTNSTSDIFSEKFELSVFPNPITDASVINFSLKKKTPIELKIWNQEGKLIKTLLDGSQQVKGKHMISFLGVDLPSGMYWLSLSSENLQQTIPILVE